MILEKAAINPNSAWFTVLIDFIGKELRDRHQEVNPDLLPALKKAKVVDSGGMGLYIILQGMTDALTQGIKAEIKDVKIRRK